jgi:hypothetical protein
MSATLFFPHLAIIKFPKETRRGEPRHRDLDRISTKPTPRSRRRKETEHTGLRFVSRSHLIRGALLRLRKTSSISAARTGMSRVPRWLLGTLTAGSRATTSATFTIETHDKAIRPRRSPGILPEFILNIAPHVAAGLQVVTLFLTSIGSDQFVFQARVPKD